MPEGDTIFRSARALHQALAGQTISLFETAYAPLASVNDQSPVAGRTVEQVESRGKWLLIHFSGDLILTTHMLMSGSWHIYRVGERWKRARSHMRIVLGTADLVAVAFDVPVARFYTARTLERFAGVAGLGPDVLGKQFAADEAAARMLERGDEEVGNVLLNQRVMAGIGNVFKSEICFACGVPSLPQNRHPERAGDRMPAGDRAPLPRGQRRRWCRRRHRNLHRRPAHHRIKQSRSQAVGLSPRRRRLQTLRDHDSYPQARHWCALHLLVPRLPKTFKERVKPRRLNNPLKNKSLTK
jgi:formamidopyrimidine-DNA glycosylase